MFQIPFGKNLLSFNLSNKRIIHLLSLLIVIIFSLFLFFFPSRVTFAHDVLIGILAMPMFFCLDNLFGFSI